MALKTLSQGLGILDSSEPFDVCIIGSGFAGTILGNSLVSRGVRTVILESGNTLIRWFADSRLRQLAAYNTSGNANYLTSNTKARAIGGNSNFWTGRAERLHPIDFEKNAYTPTSNPWPITYNEIEPYYEQAEKTLRVRGGALSEYHPPRKNILPLPPSTDISALKAMYAKVGVTIDDSPTATPTKGWRFFRLHKELLPAFTASPHALLVTGVTVTRLNTDSNRRVVGAEVRTMDGTTKIVRSRLYVVACGGIESPRLLLLSHSELYPNGIGNAYDRVGRGFNEHPGVNFFAKIPHTRNTLYPSHKIGRTHQYYDEFKRQGLGGVLPVFIQSWIFPNHLMSFKLSKIPKNISYMLSRLSKAQIYIGTINEQYPDDENRVTLDERSKDYFGNPLANLSLRFTEIDRKTLTRTRQLIRSIFAQLNAQDIRESELTWSRHHIGTCRMGDNPKTSVVDRDLRVHEASNLYVAGSETFVTGGAEPPVLTITALAHRLADHLTTRLEKG